MTVDFRLGFGAPEALVNAGAVIGYERRDKSMQQEKMELDLEVGLLLKAFK